MANQLESNTPNTNTNSAKPNVFVIVMGVVLVALLCIIAYLLINPHQASSENANNGHASSHSKQTESEGGIPEEVRPFEDPKRAAEAIKEITRKDPNDPLAKGSVNAPVTMIQFLDFSCPMCTKFEVEVAPKLQHFIDNGTLRIEHHQMPIFEERFHSDLAAAGSIAAGNQGKFWEFLHEAMELSKDEGHVVWTKQKVLDTARKAGISDLAKFQQDMDAKSTKERIEKELAEAQRFGIQGTPAFLLNDRIIPGALPYTVFEQAIKAMAAGAK